MAADTPVNRAPFTPEEMECATGGHWLPPGAGRPGAAAFGSTTGAVAVLGVSTDSRTIEAGQLFVALAGERFDGHDHVAGAFGRGAAAAVVSRPVAADGPLLLVADTLAALHGLARHHRARFDIPLVGLTGSNGKTTTKEMIAGALAALGPVHKTAGNLNNQIGVPLTLLGLTPVHRLAVVEMGTNHPGEIRTLAGLARPGVAVITNAARAHLEGLGSREAVVEAKCEIAEGLSAGDTLVYFGDDPQLREKNQGRPCRQLTFGFGSTAELRATGIVERGLAGTEFDVEGFDRIRLSIPGRHNVLNALAALAVSRVLGVPPPAAAAALAGVGPARGRMELKPVNGLLIIDDTYNANPDSMRAALDLLREAPHRGRRLAVLGEMLELGRATAALHREIGAAASFVDRLFVIGASAAETAAAAIESGLAPECAVVARDPGTLARKVLEELKDGDLLLVKASRGMALEKLVQAIEADRSGAPGKGR